MRRRGLNARLIAGAAVLLLLIAGAFTLTVTGIDRLHGANRELQRSLQRISAADDFERLAIDLETGMRGYLITRDPRFLQPYDAAVLRLPAAGRALLGSIPLAATTRRQLAQDVIADIDAYVRGYVASQIALTRRDPAAARQAAAVGEGKRQVDHIRADFTRLDGIERANAARIRRDSDDASSRALLFALLGLAICPLLVLLFAGYLSRLVVLPIRRVAAAAIRVASGDLGGRVPESGRGEAVALARSFNTMSETLQQSRDELESQNAELEAQQGELERALDALADEKQRNERYHEVVAHISSEAAVEPLAELLLRDLGEILEADAGTLYVLDVSDFAAPHVLAAVSGFERDRVPQRLAANAGLAGRALAERRIVQASHEGTELRISAFGADVPVQHELHVPFFNSTGEHAAGIASFVRSADRPFTPSQLELLAGLSESVAIGLSRSLTFEYAQHHARVNQAVIETAQDAYIGVDEDATIVAWTPQAQTLFGYGEEEAIGRSIPELLVPERHRAEYVASHRRLVSEAHQAASVTHRFELYAQHKDHHEFLIELSVAPVRVAGRWRLNGFVRDITGRVDRDRERDARAAVSRILAERKGVQELIDPVLQALGEALHWQLVVFWTPADDGRLHCRGIWHDPRVAQSQKLEELTQASGLERGEGQPGWAWSAESPRWSLVRAEEGPRSRAAAAAGLRASASVPIGAGRQLLGVLEFFRWEARAPDEELLETLAAISDLVVEVTERRRAEQEAERLKNEFFALVSHELRTPLTSIVGYLELVLEREAGDVTEQQERFLGIVERNARRLQRLVGDLLFVAQVEAGTLNLERRRAQLETIVRDAVAAALPRAEQLQVTVLADAEPVPEIEGDPDRLGQLVDNLISNALKFTPAGGSVTVALHRSGGMLELSVTDTGIGIPAAEQARLFDRFFRASTAVEREIPGIGLGLSICRAIADGHGGRIEVESTVGAGTTFRVTLPLDARVVPRQPHLPSGAREA
ncbi:MAG: multi-sensor signal transduction histidine kinase [Conexibacter sp.]|nr:multi-sensor signal transduction histidine kinase [Conexibacter sp.]